MSLEDTLREVCNNLLSVRATERKKSADTLKDFLTRNAVPSLLTQNTLKLTGKTWNNVFDDVNEYVMKETEKYEHAKNFQTVTGPLCKSLLHLCVAGSNKGKTYIKCEKIIDACLYVLNSKRLTSAVGDAYLSLLYKYVFPVEYYLGSISPASWENLLEVCISALVTNSSQLDDLLKIRLVFYVVKNAINSCQFVVPLRDCIPKLKKCIARSADDKKLQEFIMEIIILLIKTLASECRHTMCEFTESVLPMVMKFYEQSMEQKKKSLLFKLFELTLILHHPLTKVDSFDCDLAHDWRDWNKHLQSILEVVSLEINSVEKFRKHKDNVSLQSSSFSFVAAAVFYQVFKMPEKTIEGAGNVAKKQRTSFNKNKSFNDLIQELHSNQVPWIGIVRMYVKHYRSNLSCVDYLALINTSEFIISNSSRDLNWDAFEELSRLILTYVADTYCGENDINNAILCLWNTCVRNVGISNESQKAIHTIIQLILKLDILKYQVIQPLLLLYLENGISVNEYSLRTLSLIFNKFYTKCCYLDVRQKCFAWFTKDESFEFKQTTTQDFFLRLLCKENINMISQYDVSGTHETNTIYDLLVTSSGSIFEYEWNKYSKEIPKEIKENLEINKSMNKAIITFLDQSLSIVIVKLSSNEIDLIPYAKTLNMTLMYFDTILSYYLQNEMEVTTMPLLYTLQSALKHFYVAVTKILKSEVLIRDKVAILKCVQNILMYEYHPLLCIEIRKYIEDKYFHCIHNILKNDCVSDETEMDYEDDLDMSIMGLKQNCIYVLAAYCRKKSAYTDELLKCILDIDMYNCNSPWDVECAYRCIRILNDPVLEQRPTELIFNLLRKMCKDLFRNCKATKGLLEIIITMLEQIWSLGANIMMQNCIIMIKSYVQRCTKMFYPPHVAALVYECVAKILQLNCNDNYELNSSFKDILLENVKSNVHCIRLYCCYLLKYIAKEFTDNDIESLVEKVSELFVIKVSEENQIALNDELSNRTLTVLYSLYVVGLTNRPLVNKIIIKAMHMCCDKKMDSNLVKNVLNKLTQSVVSAEFEVYLNDNVLLFLYYWFEKGKNFSELPVTLFGFDTLDKFVENHITFLIPCEILWAHSGNVDNSKALTYVQTRKGISREDVLETCFCNIIILCLPHIVIDKYKLNNERHLKFKSLEKANRMFQITRNVLKNEKWSTLFVENLGELLLLSASHTRDHCAASEVFGMRTIDDGNSYTFTKDVFLAILRYFGELIDGDIMQYLCENQPLVLLNILFKLWNRVATDKVIEFKIVSLHTFITFVKSIPLGFSSDVLLFNFVCNNFMHALKYSKTKDDIQMFVTGMKILITIILSHPRKDINLLQKSTLTETVSILTLKKEEGYDTTCDPLLNFLTRDTSMKEYLTQGVDVVDYVDLLCEKVETSTQVSKEKFLEKFDTFISSLPNVSHNILSNMCNFIRQNRSFMNQLSMELSVKGFSDECGKSSIHQAVLLLSKILKTSRNEKIIIEACNCMAEIGIYDLKTFVTAPPPDTHQVVQIHPKQYFTMCVLSTLSQYLLDADSNVSNKVAKAINQVLKFRDGKAALELFDLDKQMLMSLSPSDCEFYAEYKINNEKFDLLNTDGYWTPDRGEHHSQWISRITISLLDVFVDQSNYTNALRAVCAMQASICSKVLPSLVGLLLESSSEKRTQVIGDQINQVFKYIWDTSFQDNIGNSEDCYSSNLSPVIDHDYKMIINYLMDVVNFVRIQRHHYTIRSREQNVLNYLGLEYDRVAWAATVAEQHVAGVYYGELWAAARAGGVPPASPAAATGLPGGEHVQTIFRRCFVSIGEMDAIEGCGTAHLTSEEEKRKHLISSGQFADALLLHDIALSRGNSDHNLQYGAVTSLHKSGMHHLALQYIKSFPENDDLNDIKYECLSYLGDWSDFVDTQELEEKSKKQIGYSKSIINSMRYACLKDCLTLEPSKDFDTKLMKPLNRAKLTTARLCQNLKMENSQNVYKIMSILHLFRDIEDYFSVRSDKTSVTEILNKWSVAMLPPFNDFKYLETIITQRSLILEYAAKDYAAHATNITELQLQYAELGLSNRRIQMAQRLVSAIKTDEKKEKVTLLESQISWAKGHKDIALSLLNGIVSKQSEDLKWAAMSLRQYGLWMAECKRENGRDIINRYLEKSMKMLSGRDNVDIRLKVYYDIAKFADAEYKQVVTYMNSSEFENKLKCMEDMKGTAASLKSSQQSLTRDEKKAMITNNAFQQLDQAEIANLKAEKDSFLILAMRYYLLSLAQCDENNLSVFRVISLWFDNPTVDLADDDGRKLAQLLDAIPSWKFITVLPQLAPRLSNDNDQFSNLLRKLILRCAMEHPHHTLPILFNLKNSEKDKSMGNVGRSGGAGVVKGAGARSSGGGSAGARVEAAAAALARVGAPATPLAAVVAQMELICDATISFAYCVPKSKDLRPQAIPKTEPISKLRNLDCVPIPTDTIAIQKDCDYSRIQTLTGFDNYFELVGGINYPKKISCLSSDGKKRILLIKGEDDLRQDAVMQQVFNIVNTLLEKNPVTYRSKLSIRTYKVVAMSRRSGVLEWCEGTMPLGVYLLAAHTRYRPQDIPPSSARAKLKECHENRRSNKYKLEVFNDILKVFKPVFHYFFTEHYLDPVTWYERRLAYTRSVATSSMVGYIMGLGDRHVQNILIDKNTAEVIHIDFGIAFDQGKTLPTPETVPFRLTQDIVAGFGSSGVEGIFRRCCEKSLQLLRDNQETLVTILEVLLCDPLYLWIVPSTTRSPRCPAEQQAGGLAERALLAVRSKLSGAEGGAGGVSVPGHVAGLLSAAAEPANLCRLFPGWQPYL